MIGRNLRRIRVCRVVRPMVPVRFNSTKKDLLLDEEFQHILDTLETPSKVENETFQVENDLSEDNKEFLMLNDFINQEYSGKNGLEGITDQIAKHRDTEFKPVDIDQNDENFDGSMFELDFVKDNDSNVATNKILEEEKQLFQNIFNSYMEPTTEIEDSVYVTKQRMDMMRKKSHDLSRVSRQLQQTLFDKTKTALEPTVRYISQLGTSSEVVTYFGTLVSHWLELVSLKLSDLPLEIYLTELLQTSNEFSPAHQKFLDDIESQTQALPQAPALNVFTFPVLFNAILKHTAFELNDGQLALTLFNLLKKDLNLYTVVCNQETYNEILRILWIYNGKSNLYTVEMSFMEMKNNGFAGDLATFNTLKQIIIDYYQLKMGKLVNKDTGLPIWTTEDDKRVGNLERNLRKLANSLTES